MTEISGKLAVVTGAASGIGRGTALELAKRGARPIQLQRERWARLQGY